MSVRSEINGQSLAVAFSTMIATMCSSMVFAMTAAAVFMDRIAADYGWGHGAIGAAVTILSFGTAISSRIFGPLVDRLGPRAITLPLTLGSGLILAGVALVGNSLPAFYVAYFLLGLASPGAVAHSKLISTWFFRRRGMALTAMALGAAVAQMAVPPAARAAMQAIGWQKTYLAMGIVGLLICFPILLALYRERDVASADGGALANSEIRPDGAPAISIRQAMATRSYWLIVGGQIAAIFAYTGVGTHAVGILAEQGVAPEFRVLGLSLLAFGALAAQLAIGILLDLFDTPRVVVPFAAAALCGLALLFLGRGEAMVLTGILLFGLGSGGETAMTSYFIGRYFGVRNFSTIYGSLFLLLIIGASGSIVVGAIYDWTGTYDLAFFCLGGALLITVSLLLLLGPYPYPVKDGRSALTHAADAPTAPQAG